ncbi:MAG: protein translocase subunit SecF [Clostridia bacterium]|nr:protein translocase subunit SecF [Clostridia bacterium]
MDRLIKDRSKICLLVSGTIIVLAIVLSLFGLGVNLGIDFAGGLNIKYELNEAFKTADVETALRNAGADTFTITAMGPAKSELQIRMKEESGMDVQVILQSLEKELGEKYTQMDISKAAVSFVGPVAGTTLVRNAIMSVLICSALMLVYIAIRFDFYSGMAALTGLLHDVLIMLAFMVLFRSFIQVNSSFIAAALTIVGYSINNTIIIFDRIRENRRGKSNLSPTEMANKSVRECLGRTINTSLTTLITITSLYVLGVDSIKEFALPIIIGLISGIYSSNMINPYLWVFYEKKLHKTKTLKAKKA